MQGNSVFNTVAKSNPVEIAQPVNNVGANLQNKVLLENLKEAIISNKVDSVKNLIAKLNAMEDYMLISTLQDDGNFKSISFLSLAVIRSSEQVVLELLKHNAININVVTSEGLSPFMLAASYGRYDVLDMLWNDNRTVNKNAVNIKGSDALMLAVVGGHLAVVTWLILKGFAVNQKNDNGWTPLMYASHFGYLGIVQLLLDNGAHINEQNASGSTALMCAVEKNYIEIAKLLIDIEALDINASDVHGRTAFMLAVMKNRGAIVEALLTYPQDIINVFDKEGQTPIMLAAYNGYTDIVQLILGSGREIDFSTKCNKHNALALAQLNKHEAIEKLIYKYQMDSTHGLIKKLGLFTTPIQLSSATLVSI